MKAILKTNPDEIGQITSVYIDPNGFKRIVVRFPYASVDAIAADIEIVEEK